MPTLSIRHCRRLCFIVLCAMGGLHSLTTTTAADEPETFAEAMQVLRSSCADCHAEGAREGGFSIEDVAEETSLKDKFDLWRKIRRRVNERSMPPMDAEPLADDVRNVLVQWVETASVAAICADGPSAGPPMFRRLARYEYSNSVRDLLNVHFGAGRELPLDAGGGEGFANAAETLTISPIHAEKYLQAATEALDYVARDAGARRRLLRSRPGDELTAEDAARQNLARLCSQAFRRPVDEQEIDRFVSIYKTALADGLPEEEAQLYAMRGILISPSFLFIAEANPQQPNTPELLSSHEIATRLSYFLWASMPDGELRRAADAGNLNTEEELQKHTLRLISARGTHLQDSMEQFMGSWLGTADLGTAKQIDSPRYAWLADPHVAALRKQPVVIMESMLQNNDSLLDLIDANWTFLNNELMRVYRLQKKNIPEEFVQRLVRVTLPEEYKYRGGLLGVGGVMALNSQPGRSSPVQRGAWVLEKMLGVELPPPPPDVPDLSETAVDAELATLRARLEQHRANPSCATCHNQIDPIGFALENFDEIGRWRTKDSEQPIDETVTLPYGRTLEGVAGLKQHLMAEKDTFLRVLTRKMLAYALGRSLQPADLCTVELIVERVKQNDYRSQELVLGIVLSEPFRKKILRAQETSPKETQ